MHRQRVLRYHVAVGTYLGIDGGGSVTHARVEDGEGRVLFERSGPGTNPRTTSQSLLDERFEDLLSNCPAPTTAAVCLAGLAGPDTQAVAARSFKRCFPDTEARFEPDFATALRVFPRDVTACVIAGTGSLVCSRASDGRVITNGGKGFILGDEGSAFRLGRALLSRYLEDPSLHDALAASVADALSLEEGCSVIATVHSAPDPARIVGQAAPLLTAAAHAGHAWAIELVDREMAELAALVGLHLHRHHESITDPVLGLSGGVWNSDAAREAFARHVAEHVAGVAQYERPVITPVEAAVHLARELSS